MTSLLKLHCKCPVKIFAESFLQKLFELFTRSSDFEWKFLRNFETWRKSSASLAKFVFTCPVDFFEESLIWNKNFSFFLVFEEQFSNKMSKKFSVVVLKTAIYASRANVWIKTSFSWKYRFIKGLFLVFQRRFSDRWRKFSAVLSKLRILLFRRKFWETSF